MNHILLAASLGTVFSAVAMEQPSTSHAPVTHKAPVAKNMAARDDSNRINITFSEFSSGTSITGQYRDKGVVFGGDAPFITPDGANPTSPVLSGSPLYEGAIEGYFVVPDTDEKTSVAEFSIDGGYFDEYGTVRISVFDKEGNRIGQKIANQIGIQNFSFEGVIHRFRIETIAHEPSGYAIDNVSFVPLKNAVVFREKEEAGSRDGFWSFLDDEVPGYDHVGFSYSGEVYESHPGYYPGIYVSEDGESTTYVQRRNGVQKEHILETFKYYSQIKGQTKVTQTNEIQISDDLAKQMAEAADSAIAQGATFNYLTSDYFDFATLEEWLSPAAQKGDDNTYTCVGLVEWAAEQAGHRSGQGFIDNRYESFALTIPEFQEGDTLPTLKTYELPLLSPEWLEHVMRFGQGSEGIAEWALGWFDPVDVIVTDPVGRRVGTLGDEVFAEVPSAFVTPNGFIDMLAIPYPLPGKYSVKFVGLGTHAKGGFRVGDNMITINQTLEEGEVITKETYVALTGDYLERVDVNGDSLLDENDVIMLQTLVGRYTDGLFGAGDLNNNGEYDVEDAQLLAELVLALSEEVIPQDVDRSSVVDEADGLLVLADLGTCSDEDGNFAAADINSDGCVTWLDYQSWWKVAHAMEDLGEEADVSLSNGKGFVGESVKLSLTLSQMALGLEAELLFDSERLRFVSAVAEHSDYRVKSWHNGNGNIQFVASTLAPQNISGDVVVTFEFMPLIAGDADIRLTSNEIADAGVVGNRVAAVDVTAVISAEKAHDSEESETEDEKEQHGSSTGLLSLLILFGLLVRHRRFR
ncbi:hypothetical protein [Thaumasiovibrio sp. DFM-14]|uniref:hypothetical protein n=1 Tax=Thaumasiovibrio sp. DFM-14 TaxID=3384792 RepID=UPI0039A16AEE